MKSLIEAAQRKNHKLNPGALCWLEIKEDKAEPTGKAITQHPGKQDKNQVSVSTVSDGQKCSGRECESVLSAKGAIGDAGRR